MSEWWNQKKLLSKLWVGDLSFGVALSLAFRFMATVSSSAVRCSAVEVQVFGYRGAGRIVLGPSRWRRGQCGQGGKFVEQNMMGREAEVLQVHGSPIRHYRGPLLE